MMRSLFSGISGLRNHQTRMDVIGNNIANVNTAGYKTARVIFQDIFSQNVSAGMANQETIGGTNPMQIGLGIRLSTVDIIHSRAAFQRTDKETDMMINGDGFFIVGQQNPETGQYETFYTRAGNFDLDNEGYLVTSQGFYVMGRTYNLRMAVISPGNEQVERRDLLVRGQFHQAFPEAAGGLAGTSIGAAIAQMVTDGDIPAGPFDAAWFTANGPIVIEAGSLYEGNDGSRRAMVPPNNITISSAEQYTARMADIIPGHPPLDANPIPANGFRIGDVIPAGLFGDTGGATPVPIPEETVVINAGNIHEWNNDTARVPVLPWPAAPVPAVSAVPYRAPVFGLAADPDYLAGDENGLTRIRATADRIRLPEDPITRLPVGFRARDVGETDAEYTAYLEEWITLQEDQYGTEEIGLPGLGVADNGDISVIVGNRKIVIGRVAIAMFANPAGLETAGNSLYRQTASSGQVVVTEAFADGAGKVEGGGLEMSNVDLANEFTDMIVTQRGFQANSRIISVTDTMLEELVNLKR